MSGRWAGRGVCRRHRGRCVWKADAWHEAESVAGQRRRGQHAVARREGPARARAGGACGGSCCGTCVFLWRRSVLTAFPWGTGPVPIELPRYEKKITGGYSATTPRARHVWREERESARAPDCRGAHVSVSGEKAGNSLQDAPPSVQSSTLHPLNGWRSKFNATCFSCN